ncbi:hypothetical protein ACFQ34_33475 [Pseudonocardia benzenivorans]|uniref:Uncharacterized protein n=1 Tax=Pseudonocardia benzenivorans TaxID=228005 RepID=A0ABW3VV16_9PSEU
MAVELGDEISLAAPQEPPARAIVVDRDGNGWQRSPGGRKWLRTGHVMTIMGSGDGLKWATLLLTFGPVEVVYLPAKVEGEA